jgi:hypothetical protein
MNTDDEAELLKLKKHKTKEKRKVTPRPLQRAPQQDFMRKTEAFAQLRKYHG